MTLWAISGGSGFLGLGLARRLVAGRLRVRTLDLVPLAEPSVEAIVGDIRREEHAAALCRGADVLVHAATTLPNRGSAAELRSVNVDGTATLLRAAEQAGVRRVIMVSSAVIYGLQPPPIAEHAEPRPIELYGRAKLEAERLALAQHAVVLRPTAFVGPGRLGVFGILFRFVREGRRVYTVGSGGNRYQLLDVDDLIDAILAAGKRPVSGTAFNLGADAPCTVGETLEALVRHAGSGSRITSLPARPTRSALATLYRLGLSPLSRWHYASADQDVVLDTSRAKELLGWTPRFTSMEALTRAYDWYVREGANLPAGDTHRLPWRERALTVVRRLS
ncbi:MAG: NAD-dependent epimerase/dehydratase family protein [Actinobacteria bacterium]|nr:NAD-dependent epimerase/dehydratase family protein [Actinomycetota bacterium]